MRILFFVISLMAMPFGVAQAQNYVGISGGLMTYEANDTEIDSQGFTVVAGLKVGFMLLNLWAQVSI